MHEELKAISLKVEDLIEDSIDCRKEAVISRKNCSLKIKVERPFLDEYFS